MALDFTHDTRPLLASLEKEFKIRLLENTQYHCLCMHHLQMTNHTQWQICATPTPQRDGVYLMVNPRLVGRSNDTMTKLEYSISCATPQFNERARVVFVEWTDPKTRTQYEKQFAHERAACLQQSIDEMVLGNRWCK